MQISLTPDEEGQLRRYANEVGYESAERFLLDLARDHVNSLPYLTEEELEASAAMCDRGMRDAEAGRVMSIEESRRWLLESLNHRPE